MANRSHRFISALWPKLSTLITGYIPCDLPDVLIQFLQVIIPAGFVHDSHDISNQVRGYFI